MFNGLPQNIKSLVQLETLTRGRGGRVNPKVVVEAVKKKLSPENKQLLEERTKAVMDDLDHAVKEGTFK